MIVRKYISAKVGMYYLVCTYELKLGFFLSCRQWTNSFSTRIHIETKTAFSNKRILKIWCEIDLSSTL